VIKPKAVIPMHYWIKGLNLPLKPVDDFLAVKPSSWNVVKLSSNQIEVSAQNIPINTVIVLSPP